MMPHKDELAEDEHDDDVYGAEGREELTEDAEISPEEDGFMEGYEAGAKESVCQNCGKVIVDGAVERKVEDETLFFCSARCADSYKAKEKSGW